MIGCPLQDTEMVFTVLGELSGAGKRGDLEAVLGDGDGTRVVEAPPCLLLLLLHLQPGGRQPQVHLGILRLLGVRLATKRQVGGSQSAEPRGVEERLDQSGSAHCYLVDDELMASVLQRGAVVPHQPHEGHPERLLRFVPSCREGGVRKRREG